MKKENPYICFFNSHKVWGGGEKWHADTANFLHGNNHKVIVCGNIKGALLTRISSSIIRIGVTLSNLSFLNPLAYIKTYRILKKYPINTIILCLPIDVKVAGVAAKLAGVSNIVYRRGCAIPIKNSLVNRFLFSKIITHIIANSEATKESILANNPNLIPREKITVLYNGIEIIPRISKQIKSSDSPFIIGTAGRLEPQKNMLAVIEIAKELRKQYSNFVITLAGEGALRSQLEAEIEQNGLQNHIQLSGFLTNMHDFYSSLDVFILTSHGEGFGYVLAEAMMYEVPLIAYEVSSSNELIKNAYNGYLVPKDDIKEFVQKIILCMQQVNLTKILGLNARLFVEEHFDAAKMNAKSEAFILHL